MSEVVPYAGRMVGSTDTAKYAGPTPPYIALQTFLSMLDLLRERGVPPVFDGSFFEGSSGSTIALHRAAFKAFGLMNEDKTPTPLMHELVAADDDGRKAILTEVGRVIYADCIALGEARGTNGQLAEVFRSKGITGATVQKATSFYLSFAEYAGYPVSPFFKKGRVSNASNGSATRRMRRKAPPPPSDPQPPAPVVHHVTPGRSVEDEQKVKYIDLLMKLAMPADGAGEVNADILDRIERMLHVEPASKSKEEGD